MSKCFGRSRVGAALEEDRLFSARSAPKLWGNSKRHVWRSARAWLDRNKDSSAIRDRSEDRAVETASIQTLTRRERVEEWAVKITLSSSVGVRRTKVCVV